MTLSELFAVVWGTPRLTGQAIVAFHQLFTAHIVGSFDDKITL